MCCNGQRGQRSSARKAGREREMMRYVSNEHWGYNNIVSAFGRSEKTDMVVESDLMGALRSKGSLGMLVCR